MLEVKPKLKHIIVNAYTYERGQIELPEAKDIIWEQPIHLRVQAKGDYNSQRSILNPKRGLFSVSMPNNASWSNNARMTSQMSYIKNVRRNHLKQMCDRLVLDLLVMKQDMWAIERECDVYVMCMS